MLQSMASCHLDKYLEINMVKKLVDTATKTGLDAKTVSERVVKRTAEATGDLIGNKIADKITSVGKTKSREKEDERQEIYIPLKKRQQIIDDLKFS